MAQKDYKGPLDYIDVATRIVEFREKFPGGSLQQVDLRFENVGGKDFVIYTAAAYRSPEDLRPGIGTAWEPVPGPTQFTRDSEVQNAETAAWGRAMVAALAVDTKKGIASSEEVRNRQAASPPAAAGAPAVDWLTAVESLSTKDEARKLYTDAQKARVAKPILEAIEAKAAKLAE